MPYIGTKPVSQFIAQQSFKVYVYTATAGQTVFSGADVNNQVLNVTPSNVEVHMNGLLLDATDYTVISSSVTLSTAANAGDELTITGLESFEVADTYDKATADGRYVNTAGDTMTGALALPSAGLTVGTDQLAVDSAGRVTMADQPGFMARKSNFILTPWSVAASWTSINTGNHGGFNASTGAFTAPVTGLYLFYVALRSLDASGNNGVAGLQFWKNGSQWEGTDIWGGYAASYAGVIRPSVTATVNMYLSANDYAQVGIVGNISNAYFGGHLIG